MVSKRYLICEYKIISLVFFYRKKKVFFSHWIQNTSTLKKNQMPSKYLPTRLIVCLQFVFLGSRSVSSVGLEHHLDRVGVVGSNPTRNTLLI